MDGNFDTTTPVIRVLDPPIVASRIRFVPSSKNTRTVCMRAEIHGCKHEGSNFTLKKNKSKTIFHSGVTYYSTVPDGSRLDTLDFKDSMFEDSQIYTESGIKRYVIYTTCIVERASENIYAYKKNKIKG